MPDRFLQLMTILKIKYLILAACLYIAMSTGCALIQGKSVRTYQLEYNTAVQASTNALEYLEMRIFEEKSDKLKTQILARRVNGKPISVEVKRVDRNFTQVAVASGAGVDRWLDAKVSDQIHEFIRKQLVKPSKGVKWPE
jgi:predicted PP-loop superfamily ATPase